MQMEIQYKYKRDANRNTMQIPALHSQEKSLHPPGNIPAGGIGWEAALYSNRTLGRTVQLQNCAAREIQLHSFVCGNIN